VIVLRGTDAASRKAYRKSDRFPDSSPVVRIFEVLDLKGWELKEGVLSRAFMESAFNALKPPVSGLSMTKI